MKTKLRVSMLTGCHVCGNQVPLRLKRKGLEEISLEELKLALNSDEDVVAGHLVEQQHTPDHEWKLVRQEKKNLLEELLRREDAK
jgi:hypothetical protein